MTDEELDALVEALRDVADHAGYVPHLHHTAATAITTLRAQLAEAQRLMRLERTIADKNADRADRAEAALAAQIEVDAGLCGQNEMAIPMDHTKRTLGGLYCADVWCGEGKHAGHGYADLIRSQPHDRTALDWMLTEAREVSEADKIAIRNKALLDAVDACRLYDAWGECRKAILAMIDKEKTE